MAKYYQRKDGWYEASRTINGKRVRFLGKTCRDVDHKILKYRADLTRGRKLPVVAAEWFKELEKDVDAGNLAINTWKSYKKPMERISEAFAGRYAGEIQPCELQRYIRAMEAKDYAKSTVNIELTVIRGIFAHAVHAGDINLSPARDVQLSRGLPKKDVPALTEEQEKKVIQCRTGEWWLLGLALLYTGCRKCELLALTYSDIDRERGVIHVNKKLNWANGNTPTVEYRLKNALSRDIPLLEPLAEALPRDRVGIIFPGKDGGYMTGSQFVYAWRQYCEDAGIGKANAHQFRHTLATLCYECGISLKDTAAFLGDTEKVVDKIYTDLRENHHQMQLERLTERIRERAAEG